jgi:hypothetical protein
VQFAELPGYPVDVWKRAVELIVEHTALSCAYVAAVVPAEEPDFMPEEDAEEVEADNDFADEEVSGPQAEGDVEQGEAEDDEDVNNAKEVPNKF